MSRILGRYMSGQRDITTTGFIQAIVSPILSQARNVITDVKKPETTLFFEQRRFRHLDAEPVGEDDRFVRAILGRIRDLSGGQVLGPADELP